MAGCYPHIARLPSGSETLGRNMVPSEELRSAIMSKVADLRDIPLAELSVLDFDLLGNAIGRVLQDSSADLTPVGAFQSRI